MSDFTKNSLLFPNLTFFANGLNFESLKFIKCKMSIKIYTRKII